MRDGACPVKGAPRRHGWVKLRCVFQWSGSVSMPDEEVRRDHGATWRERLAEARDRLARPGPRLRAADIAALRHAVETLDVSSPEDRALLWSGRDILTHVPMDGAAADGPLWWDKLSVREAEVFRKLGIGFTLEDTQAGAFLTEARLYYPEHDPLSAVARTLWEALSVRFVRAARGRIELIAEGSLEDSVFRTVELGALLRNEAITAVNGLDRRLLPPDANEAYALLRRWDVERSRRYAAFLATDTDATPTERAVALDDLREVQLWYEQDYFDRLGPARALPSLPDAVAGAVDLSRVSRAWKYAPRWRRFVRETAGPSD